VTFDPFNLLNVHLPPTHRVIPITLFVENRNPQAWGVENVQYGIKVDNTDTIEDLKERLSDMCSLPSDQLTICDVYQHKLISIHNTMSDEVSSISNDENLIAYNVDYDQPDVQVVVCHKEVVKNDRGESELHAFGVPYFGSFSPRSTCAQIRKHLWLQYRKFIDRDDNFNSASLTIRIVDNRGDPINILVQEKSETSSDPFSFPNTLETLSDLFGNDCADSYLFLRIEWAEQHWIDKLNGVADGPPMRHNSMNVSNGVSLYQCIEHFTQPERLDKDNKYYCSNCKEHVRAMKTMKLCELPDVLIIHLKRFEFKTTFRRNSKLETFIECPINGLNMNRFIRSPNQEKNIIFDDVPAIYDLFAVTNHYGRMGYGHYTSCCRQWDDNEMGDDWTLVSSFFVLTGYLDDFTL